VKNFQEMLITAFIAGLIGALLGAGAMRDNIVGDCDTLTAVQLSGHAYTCFKELTEEDDK